MRAGAALIQRQYRRYRVSKRAAKAIRIVRRRLQKATEEYCETNTLKYRSAEALNVLLRCKSLAGVTSHCRCLEMATRNSSQCAQVNLFLWLHATMIVVFVKLYQLCEHLNPSTEFCGAACGRSTPSVD